MTLRYGLIGAGMMGQEHIRNLHLIPDVTVTAIADPDEGMRSAALAAAGGGVQGFPDYHQMLSADLCDAYVLATPNDLHYPHLLDLLTTPKPLLIEKPLCTTAEHCHEVLARAAGRSPRSGWRWSTATCRRCSSFWPSCGPDGSARRG